MCSRASAISAIVHVMDVIESSKGYSCATVSRMSVVELGYIEIGIRSPA